MTATTIRQVNANRVGDQNGAANDNRVGDLLREWRQRRRLSQLDLALDAGVSSRHLSFVETGRSRPSPQMVVTLAQRLELPLRERNRLLLAAGYAPRYQERPLDGPELAPVRDAVSRLLAGHEPYPAIAVDTMWNLVASNGALDLLLEGVADELLVPPANCIRMALHPDGLAPRIRNLGEWRGHLLARLRREASLRRDPRLDELLAEVESYPGGEPPERSGIEIMVTLRLASSAGELTLFSTVTTFGTAVDITVAELSIETFFPADEATAEALRAAAR